jgi:hypothetical protein
MGQGMNPTVSRQRFSSHDTPLPSIGSRRVRFPDRRGVRPCARFAEIPYGINVPP